jgi:hypothetical protein
MSLRYLRAVLLIIGISLISFSWASIVLDYMTLLADRGSLAIAQFPVGPTTAGWAIIAITFAGGLALTILSVFFSQNSPSQRNEKQSLNEESEPYYMKP